MATLAEVFDNLGGALRIAGNLISQPITRSHYRFWGATQKDRQRTLPGDERVPAPIVFTTLAVTIDAPARDVWPWVAQLGQERGGMYSYELLENLVRCQMHNANRIVPEWEMKVGDQMRMGPPGYPVNQVVALERGRWLLILDTAVDVGAEALYARNGWQDVGIVPDYAVGANGQLVSTRFMWKRLAS